MEAFEFMVYKKYLIKVAEKMGRPFTIPETYETLQKRNDYQLFLILSEKLKNSGIDNSRSVDKFFSTASEIVSGFYVVDILKEYDTIKEANSKKKVLTEEETLIEIKKSFDFLKEYCLLNKIHNLEELSNGSPPIILKLWKNKKIREELLAVLFDIENVKKKTWYRIYCGGAEKIINRTRRDSRLSSFLNDELVKIKEEIVLDIRKA